MTIEIDRIRSIGIGRVAIAGWEGDTIEGGRRGGLLRGRFSMKNQHLLIPVSVVSGGSIINMIFQGQI